MFQVAFEFRNRLHSQLARMDEAYLDDVCARIRVGSVNMPDAIAAVLAACISPSPTPKHDAPLASLSQS